jgi:hypothetical protein
MGRSGPRRRRPRRRRTPRTWWPDGLTGAKGASRMSEFEGSSAPRPLAPSLTRCLSFVFYMYN